MKEHSSKLLAKALDTIEGAEGLLNMGKEEIAAGRAYYAMFYVAEALLFEIGLQFSQHGQVIAAYGKHFAKTKELDPKFHRWLRGGFDTRISGDYDVDAEISRELAAELINQAREFLEAAQQYLK
ncbi:MAG: HEPN domain-containing protein [Anaerolineae bacterium]|nr:HEPN domain-containing protein [Anaerolineae bacterium]MBL8107253.1 HEPN domain-containing protein [Anaerolineales bacterium]MCC7188412.1 HEPN domain-containing protein [Anaerolineales bacterium]